MKFLNIIIILLFLNFKFKLWFDKKNRKAWFKGISDGTNR